MIVGVHRDRVWRQRINIKPQTDDGRSYPSFLVEHIKSEWRGVNLDLIDPDICLKVDSSLSFCGCIRPTPKLRQFVYIYQQSTDFDHETVALLTRMAACVDETAACWDEVVALEFQRDCGLSRDDYLAALAAITERVEATGLLVEELMTA